MRRIGLAGAKKPRRRLHNSRRWREVSGLQLRKQDRQSGLRGEHAARIVAAKRHDGHLMPGSVLLVDILRVGLAAREAGRALSHRRTGRVKTTEWQEVEFAPEIRYRPGG